MASIARVSEQFGTQIIHAPECLAWSQLSQWCAIPISRVLVHVITPPCLDTVYANIAVVGELEAEEDYDRRYGQA